MDISKLSVMKSKRSRLQIEILSRISEINNSEDEDSKLKAIEIKNQLQYDLGMLMVDIALEPTT